MPGEYLHTKEYEKEIIRLWAEDKRLREISKQLRFSYKKIQNFETRYNAKQRNFVA